MEVASGSSVIFAIGFIVFFGIGNLKLACIFLENKMQTNENVCLTNDSSTNMKRWLNGLGYIRDEYWSGMGCLGQAYPTENLGSHSSQIPSYISKKCSNSGHKANLQRLKF